MSDLSPSEILTAAANLLRERAAAVPSEHWGARPWHVEKCANEEYDDCPCIVAQGERKPYDEPQIPMIQYVADAETPEHARYIALMHPGVGLAIAEVLEQAAEALEGADVPEDEPVVTLARQLLGGES
jgi:hypothetical protein